jgi:nucleotide-binding universal stress UspA family protein
MKNDDGILCLIDLSDSSKDTLKWAVSLATQLKKRLTVLYTYRLLSPHDADLVGIKNRTEGKAREKFASLEQTVLKDKGIKYDFIVEIGFAINRIRAYAKKNGLSVLVLGRNDGQVRSEPIEEFAESVHVPLFLVP